MTVRLSQDAVRRAIAKARRAKKRPDLLECLHTLIVVAEQLDGEREESEGRVIEMERKYCGVKGWAK